MDDPRALSYDFLCHAWNHVLLNPPKTWFDVAGPVAVAFLEAQRLGRAPVPNLGLKIQQGT
eukprot:7240086-Prorocentrum_lima.AAC.1